MIQSWNYRAISRTGSEITGKMQGSYRSVITHLARRYAHVVYVGMDFSLMWQRWQFASHLSTVAMVQFFEDFGNMHSTGLSVLQSLAALKETSKDALMINTLDKLESRVLAGDSLNEAIVHSKAFPRMVAVAVHAGEQTGRLSETLEILGQYFRRYSEIQGKLTKALTYPAVVFVVLISVMLFTSLRVVPQLKNLLPINALEHGPVQILILFSGLIEQFWPCVLTIPLAAVAGVWTFRKNNKEKFEYWLYTCPVIGNIIKESDMAFSFLNIYVLLRSGVPLTKAIVDLHAISPDQISKRLLKCRDYMFGGLPFWEALRHDLFFQPAVIFILRRGEEMARLDTYCLNLSDYLNKRVAVQMEHCINLVQPLLLIFAGLFLAMIAFAFLIPIYSSLTSLAGGQ